MTLADLAIILYLAVALYIGWKVGTIRVVAGLGSWVVGYWVARKFSALFAAQLTKSLPFLNAGGEGELSRFLSLFINTDAAANRLVQLIAFGILLVVVAYLIRKIAHLLDGVFRGTFLGVINSVLGAACSFAIGIMLFNMVFIVFLPVFATNQVVVNILGFMAEARLMLPLLGDFENMIIGGFNSL